MEGWKELKQYVGDFMCKVDAKIGQIEKTEKEAYERGLKIGEKIGMEKAWDVARQVSNMTLKTQKTIFSVEGTSHVVEKYSVAEAMERIRNYESEKQEEYKFNPGDEIVYKTDHNIRACVTSVNVGSWDGFALADVEDVCTFGGSYVDRPFEDWEKTGRKVEILKKAKEE